MTVADLPDDVLLFRFAQWQPAAEADPEAVASVEIGHGVRVVAQGMFSAWRREWLHEHAPHLTRREVADEAHRRRVRLP